MTEFTKRFKDCTLENYKIDTSEQKALVEYLKSCIDNGFKDNIVIMGGVGLGKTHLAYAVVNKLEEIKEYSQAPMFYTRKKVELTTIKAIIDGIRACWKQNADEQDYKFIRRIKEIPLLIVDEVGVQYGTESERLELFDIFNSRYNDMLPTMIISNCNKEQISKILGQRIVDRLFGGAKTFELQGASKR